MQETVEEQWGEGQLIRLVVIAVASTKVFGEGTDLAKATAGGEGLAGHIAGVGQLPGGGLCEGLLEGVVMTRHQLLRERKDVAVELKEIADGVVVLKAIETTDGQGWLWEVDRGRPQLVVQFADHCQPERLAERLSIVRGHGP